MQLMLLLSRSFDNDDDFFYLCKIVATLYNINRKENRVKMEYKKDESIDVTVGRVVCILDEIEKYYLKKQGRKQHTQSNAMRALTDIIHRPCKHIFRVEEHVRNCYPDRNDGIQFKLWQRFDMLNENLIHLTEKPLNRHHVLCGISAESMELYKKSDSRNDDNNEQN